MAGGSKGIEEIEIGEMVWAQSDRTGEVELKRVKQLFVNVAASLVVITAGTNTIEATDEHPFWVAEQGWKAAGQVQLGDELWTRSGERIRVTEVGHKKGQFTVYNFEVEDAHTYFAGENELLVHNKCILPRTDGKWVGEPGNGKWFSDKADVKRVTGGQPVEFINGRPDFSPWAKGIIPFEPGVLNGTDADFDRIYEVIMQQKGLKSKKAAEKYLKNAGLTPHHLNNTTIQLVPTKLHANIPHVGSASDMRNQ